MTYDDEVKKWRKKYEDEVEIVNRCWHTLGCYDYQDAGGRSIYEHIEKLTEQRNALLQAVTDLYGLLIDHAEVPDSRYHLVTNAAELLNGPVRLDESVCAHNYLTRHCDICRAQR